MYSKKYDASTAESTKTADNGKIDYAESNVTAVDFSSIQNATDTEAADEPPVPKDNVTVFAPQNDRNIKSLHETEGIIYEVAEMLYLKETEATKDKDEPPFHKEFSEKDITVIKQNAEKQQNETETPPKNPKTPVIKTGGTFWFLFALWIPVVNLIVDIVFIANKKLNANYRTFAKAHLIWFFIGAGIIGIGAALLFALGIDIQWDTLKTQFGIVHI
ncbi:MAG: hypothetical protein ACI4M3_02480 [Acutalibacteraceae bacterium]